MVYYERELQIESTESKSIENDLDFAEKLKIEVGRNFWNCKSRFLLKLTKIKLQFLI